MKLIMNHIISDNQSGYVGGRQIQDNITVIHEASQSLKVKRKLQKKITRRLSSI